MLLQRGEVFTEPVDCLQLSFKREGSDADEDQDEVTLGEFDLMALFAQAFDEAGVPQEIREQITDRFEAARIAD